MIIAKDVSKAYGQGPNVVQALDHVTVGFDTGAFAAIMGPSGSGKSTLMHCLAGLDTVTSGSILIGDIEVSGLSDRQLTLFRRDHVGFVFQSFNLLPALTAEQNIRLPLELAGRQPDPRWFSEVVDVLGLGDRLGHRPSELSGGQQQRVAVRPRADHPAGRHLRRRADRQPGLPVRGGGARRSCGTPSASSGQTIVMVTHDPVAASYAERVVFLADGQFNGELMNPSVAQLLDALKGQEC